MDLTNVAMVIAPNLFIKLPARQVNMNDVAMATKTSHIVRLLIKYHDLLWAVRTLSCLIPTLSLIPWDGMVTMGYPQQLLGVKCLNSSFN